MPFTFSFILQQIVDKREFSFVKRGSLADVVFPPIEQLGRYQLMKECLKNELTKVSSLVKLPSMSSCEVMRGVLENGGYQAFSSSEFGTFDVRALEDMKKFWSCVRQPKT